MHQQQQAANSNANKREIALRTQLRPTIEEVRVNISCENNKNHFIAEFLPARSSTDSFFHRFHDQGHLKQCQADCRVAFEGAQKLL